MYRKKQSYNGRTDTQKEKSRVRKTKAWRELKETVIARYWRTDPVTKAPLRKGWNLHHCDLRKENYAYLNPNKFLPLNEKTHEFIHWLYGYYVNDVNILTRLKMVMDIMLSANRKDVEI